MTKTDVINSLTIKEKSLYDSLVSAREGELSEDDNGKWWTVYLDNCQPSDIPNSSRAGVFASLAKKGLYEENSDPDARGAFGCVWTDKSD